MLGPDPVLTLHLPRSVLLTALAALGKQPLEQVAATHAVLVRAVQEAEEMAVMQVLAKRAEEQRAYREVAAGP
jgi:hypothetical protein